MSQVWFTLNDRIVGLYIYDVYIVIKLNNSNPYNADKPILVNTILNDVLNFLNLIMSNNRKFALKPN